MKKWITCGAALVFGSATLLLMNSGAVAQQKLDKNAQFCDDFDQNVIVAGKLDEASKYLTDDFIEHNARLSASGLADFTEKMKAMRANAAGRAGGGRGRGRGGPAPVRTVFSHDDVVVFISNTPEHDDPNEPGKKVPQSSHFDVYKLRNGKISEHWD